jgi:hypothetical protein
VDLAPALQRGRVDLRIGLGQVQAAIGRQAFEQDFAEVLAAGIAAGGQVQHQFSSSLRMRVIGASTVGKACIGQGRVHGAFARVVRQDDQVGLVAPSPPTSSASRCSTHRC